MFGCSNFSNHSSCLVPTVNKGCVQYEEKCFYGKGLLEICFLGKHLSFLLIFLRLVHKQKLSS